MIELELVTNAIIIAYKKTVSSLFQPDLCGIMLRKSQWKDLFCELLGCIVVLNKKLIAIANGSPVCANGTDATKTLLF